MHKIISSALVVSLILIDAIWFPSNAHTQPRATQDTTKIVKEGSQQDFKQLAKDTKETLDDPKAFAMWARVACPARKQAMGDIPEDCEGAPHDDRERVVK